MKRLMFLLSLLFFLTGCYQATLGPVMNIAGPAAGATQGRAISSAVSTGINYGVKHSTGKYPIEHVLKREKEKIVKKIDILENKVQDKSTMVKEQIIKQKNNLKSKGKEVKKKWVLHLKEIKTVKEKDAFPANKPRYSYRSK